ncbi:acid phosphatase 1-like isoform X1 [Musa acuminata AAA Group]|uniref:acid phosphatase 1-like isoform X1 n=1 Tax=Musa acuminata AAA Group TaxID=214697 RepID=UPI0031D80A8A
MGPFRFLLLFFFLGVVAAESPQTILRTTTQAVAASASASAFAYDHLYCDSWRLSVETNNARFWRTVPFRCSEFVQEYMSGARYASDTDIVVDESLAFARSVQIANDGNDAWIFDVDETLLSNVPYYAINGFGTKVFNETSFNEWVDKARAPALAASLRLYEELLVSGFQIILLTGRNEAQRKVTVENLLHAGYHSWRSLIFREDSDMGKPAVVFKSGRRAELEGQGFRILASSGDQWSDLLGFPMAQRSFKHPNPMYYIG